MTSLTRENVAETGEEDEGDEEEEVRSVTEASVNSCCFIEVASMILREAKECVRNSTCVCMYRWSEKGFRVFFFFFFKGEIFRSAPLKAQRGGRRRRYCGYLRNFVFILDFSASQTLGLFNKAHLNIGPRVCILHVSNSQDN